MTKTVKAAPGIASLALLFAAATLTACGASNPAPVSSSSAPAPAAAPSSIPSAIPTEAPTTAPTVAPAPAATVAVIVRGSMLVAANGMTVYVFNMDAAGSGRSSCNDGCSSTWPPVTVPAGTTAAGGAGISGQVATISRGDGTLQVTYNGKPLYFFANDRAPGDTKGHYTGWSLVAP